MKRRSEKPLLLLDRDGTLIEEGEYMNDPRQVRLLPGAAQGLRRLKRAGFTLAVVSNQSGVARGLITMKQLKAVNRRFLQVLKDHHASIDGLYWCPHLPSDHCACRKPKLGMVRQASRELHVPWKGSISVGDRPSDVQLGQRTGGLGVLVLTGYGHKWARSQVVKPDFRARNFRDAAAWIIQYVRKDHR